VVAIFPAMAMLAPIDDLFRQKSLDDIKSVLKRTREDVESKKRELRELVGDHYRSVLESSDHIRAMSECAAKVSAGADCIDHLIASMRSLAMSPPSTTSMGDMCSTSEAADADQDYRVAQHVMALLEVPEKVRAHLGMHCFLRAAQDALVDAASLQGEVDELLKSKGHSNERALGPRGFDFRTLVHQQAAALRSLPRQIGASCIDAFGTVALEPSGASESFVVRLLLEPSAQPVSLLETFINKRSELLHSLLDDAGVGSAQDGLNPGARLAAAAMAFEGTIVLSSALVCGNSNDKPSLLETALASALEGSRDYTVAEERAAIEGRPILESGTAVFRRRVEGLRSVMQQQKRALVSELVNLGSAFVATWVPTKPCSGPQVNCGGSGFRSLSGRFHRVAMPSPGSPVQTCAVLGEILTSCKEKIMTYRSVLAGGSIATWSATWLAACGKFCPEAECPSDALTILVSTIEAACAEVARERIGDLQLELSPSSDEDAEALEGVQLDARTQAVRESADKDIQIREEIKEIKNHSALRVHRFDDQLGDAISDLKRASADGDLPIVVMIALLNALYERLQDACQDVKLPAVEPAWSTSGRADNLVGTGSACSLRSELRASARAAVAFDTLLAAAMGERSSGHNEGTHTNLQKVLDAAGASGDVQIIKQREAILERLRQCSRDAYLSWARLAVTPKGDTTEFMAFWRLADDEVPPACGWGSAKFAPGAEGTGEAAMKSQEVRSVPIPVQLSSFVFERLALGAQRAVEVSGSSAPMKEVLVMALKTALSEAFMASFSDAHLTVENMKRSGMSHLLQWLFDLNFLRIALSSSRAPDARNVPDDTTAYDALHHLLDNAEAIALSDPVDRLLYQEVLKTSVKNHTQGLKILLAPYFLHNHLYDFLINNQPTSTSGDAGTMTSHDSESFELQAAFAPPVRPVLPRFPLLPVAMASTFGQSSAAELDARLGLDSSERGGNRVGGGASAASGSAVTSLMQQVGSGLGSLGLGKAWPPLGSSWTSSWSSSAGGMPRPPEAV